MAEIRTIGVVGLGAMGAGIAQLAIEAGYDTVGREVTAELGQAAARGSAISSPARSKRGSSSRQRRDEAVARLTLTTTSRSSAGCDLVIEAIVEELEPKRDAVRRARADLPPRGDPRDQHLGTVRDRDRGRDDKPERVVGMHFFNPAPLMPLVEIVQAELTSDDTVEAAARRSGARFGKEVVRCHDTPGFVVNRVLIPLLNDCIRVLDEARVTPEDSMQP